MNLEKEREKFFQKYGLQIKSDFFQTQQIDSYILEHVKKLLSCIPESGLKLTAKGNLPTKIVETLAYMPSTAADQSCLEFTKRFIEDEQIIAKRANVLLQVAKLTTIEKNKLVLMPKAKRFLKLSDAQQFAALFIAFFDLNVAYFDSFEEAPFIQAVLPLVVQLVRDKDAIHRSAEVFGTILLENYPQIYDAIEDEIEQRSRNKDKVERFFSLIDLRIFEHFLAPMGLVEVGEKEDLSQESQYKKTPLLDLLISSVHAVKKESVLERKRWNEFAQRIKKESLDIDLFKEMLLILSAFAIRSIESVESFAEQLVDEKKVTGAQKELYRDFYKDFTESVAMTLLEFTQLDTKGGREDLVPKYQSFMRGFYEVLNKKTPYTLAQETEFLTFTLFDILQNVFDLEITPQTATLDELLAKTNDEFIETFNAYMYSVIQIQKLCKKQKKIKPQMSEMAEQALQTYMIMIFEIYVGEF